MKDQNKQELFKNIGKDKLIIMAVAGIVLIICSYWDLSEDSGIDKAKDNSVEMNMTNDEAQADYVINMENKLEKLISNVNGAGKCKVMITVKGTNEKVLKSDTVSKSKLESGNQQLEELELTENTLVLDGDDADYPYVVKELLPEVEGVVVLAQGATNTKVNTDIINIVKALFNVEAHKISIIEMK